MPSMASPCQSMAPVRMYVTGCIVEDHARALELVVTKGKPGESYNIGGRAERTNLSVVETICDILDRNVRGAVAGAIAT